MAIAMKPDEMVKLAPDNIINAVRNVIDKEEDEKLPIQRFMGLTTDSAVVTISDRGGVYGKMKASVNQTCF